MSGLRHPRARLICTSLAVAALVASAHAAQAQPALPAPPLPPVPLGRPPIPPPPPLPAPPIPPPPPVVVESAPAEGPAYYAPPAAQPPVAPAAQPVPPAVAGWQPEDPVPEGYRKVSKPGVGYLGIGIGMFSAGWVTAMLVGGVQADAASKDKTPGALPASAWIPLFVPVAGPIITIFTANQGTQSPAGLGLLLCDAIFQNAGALGILVGATRWTHRLVRVGGVEADVNVAPMAGPGLAGLQTIGHF